MPSVFVGSEIDAYTAVSGFQSAAVGGGGAFVRHGVRSATGFVDAGGWTASLAAGWARAHVEITSWFSGHTPLLLTGGGVNLLRVVTPAANVVQLERWSGVAWVAVPGTFTRTSSTAHIFAVEWEIGASGRFAFYVDGTEVGAYVGNTTGAGVAQADKLRLATIHSSAFTYFYEVIVADEDCREWRLRTLAPTGAGTYSEQSAGSYLDVDETTPSDADLAALVAVGNRFSVAVTDVSGIASGMVCESVHVHARARHTGASPQSLELGVRGGGTDGYAAPQLLDAAYGTIKARFGALPGSAAAPTLVQLDSYELITRAAV